MIHRFALGIAASVIAATIVSALPAIVLLTREFDPAQWFTMAGQFLLLALAGNVLIGLPLGLATFAVLKSQNSLSIRSLLIVANVMSAVFAVLAFAGAGPFGGLFFGVPAIIAANCLAISGWVFAIKPSIGAAV